MKIVEQDHTADGFVETAWVSAPSPEASCVAAALEPQPGGADVLEERLEHVRGLIRAERCTYHVFRYRGDGVLYDVKTGTLLGVDGAAFALLQGLEHDRAPAELASDLRRDFDEAAIASAIDDVVSLHRLELLRLEALQSAEEREQIVRSYHGHRPRKMMLLVQTSCNLRCTYCYEVKSGFHFSKRPKAMGFEMAKASVDGLIGRSGPRPYLELTFFGGEPLINFELIEQVVAYCLEEGPRRGKSIGFAITTNGVLLTPAIIEFLVRHRFAVMLSLDGPPEDSDKARIDLGGRGVGERAVANARALVAAQVAAGVRPAMIRATLSHENHDQRKVETFFEQQGFSRTMIGASTGRAHEKLPADLTQDDVDEMQVDLDRRIDDSVREFQRTGSMASDGPLARGIAHVAEKLAMGAPSAHVGCGVGRNMLAHTADGKLYPCHRYAGDDAYQLGTVEGGIDRERLDRYYREILAVYDEHCSKCWARALCGGQCAHYVSRPDGHVGYPDEESCNNLRQAFERQLWLYGYLKTTAAGTAALATAKASHDQEEDSDD